MELAFKLVMLVGVPGEYKPMIISKEFSDTKITGDSMKVKLFKMSNQMM